ncbi:helix-turn-helix domain-containing protein [bacterium]|nr:helix-turn-helix domain-containing protein [bacterium]
MSLSNKVSEYMDRAGAEKNVWTRAEVFPHASFPFGMRCDNPQTPDQLHKHSGFWELVVVYKGEGIHFTEKEEYPVRAGDVFVIRGEQLHGYKNSQRLFLKNICFDPNQILVQVDHIKKLPGYHILFELEPKYRRAHNFESRLQLSPEETAHLMSIISLIESEMDSELPGYEYTVIALFMQAVSFLCRRYARTTRKASRNLLQMASVISHIETHYAEQIELRDLQEIAHMSSSTLLRMFKETTEYTPIEYLLRVRISKAVELLRCGETSITNVAFAVGFLDSNYFSRQFKRAMNMSPSEYRALVQPVTL